MNRIEENIKKIIYKKLYINKPIALFPPLLAAVTILCHSCKKGKGVQMKTNNIDMLPHKNIEADHPAPSSWGCLTPSELYDGEFIKEKAIERIKELEKEGIDYWNQAQPLLSRGLEKKQEVICLLEKGATCGNPNCMEALGGIKKKEGQLIQAVEWYVLAMEISFLKGKKNPYTSTIKKLEEIAQNKKLKQQQGEKIKDFLNCEVINELLRLYPFEDFHKCKSEDDKSYILGKIRQGYFRHRPFTSYLLEEEDRIKKHNWFFFLEAELAKTPESNRFLGEAYAQGHLTYHGKIDLTKAISYFEQSNLSVSASQLQEVKLKHSFNLLKQRQKEEAIKYLHEIINEETTPQIIRSKACKQLGAIYGDPSSTDYFDCKKALQYFKQSDVTEELKQALKWLVDGNYREAINYCKKVQVHASNSFEKDVAMELCMDTILYKLLEQGQTKEGINYLDEITKENVIDKKWGSKAHKYLGVIYLFGEDTGHVDCKKALQYFKQSQDVSEEFKQALEYLVDGSYIEAVNYCKKIQHTNEKVYAERLLLHMQSAGALTGIMNFKEVIEVTSNTLIKELVEPLILYNEDKISDAVRTLEGSINQMENLEDIPFKIIEKNYFKCKITLLGFYYKNRKIYNQKINELKEEIEGIQEEFLMDYKLEASISEAIHEAQWEDAISYTKQLIDKFPLRRNELQLKIDIFQKYLQEQKKGLSTQLLEATCKTIEGGLDRSPNPSSGIQIEEPIPWQIEYKDKKVEEAVALLRDFNSKMQMLLEEIQRYPWIKCGRGRPKKITNLNCFSRRINEEDRLYYRLDRSNRTVTILQCGGHDPKFCF